MKIDENFDMDGNGWLWMKIKKDGRKLRKWMKMDYGGNAVLE